MSGVSLTEGFRHYLTPSGVWLFSRTQHSVLSVADRVQFSM